MPDAPPIDLDLAGLKCPLPVLRTRKALRRLPPGTLLRVTCTDPLACLDIPNLVREEGDTLEAWDRIGTATRFSIRRGPDTCPGDSAKPPHS
ncbi:sulfurtransferase TusA family protein [Methylobacterium sp. WL6]|uniref:sulfurtransferase TusA family protein n=1 Tax=Methylobacterium sp. WL6 TaxID=2603901 RepID=UPI0011CBB4B2|nr:sulfurtransferase TusA family protein [Methylobacterium sp. WL6]TXN61304.1 sulfurtransferase TusA family protein [Methylobacterium sp. WL6]